MKTYYATENMAIQSRPIEKGQVVGKGDPEAGKFEPAEGLEDVIGFGHFESRATDGRFSTENPGGNPPDKPKRKPGRPPKSETNTSTSTSTSTAEPGE